MKLLSWNVRGINAANKKCILKHCIFKVKAEMTILQETKIDSSAGDSLGKHLGKYNWLGVPAIGASGGLGIIWDLSHISLDIIETKRSWIGFDIKCISNNLRCNLINVYGPITNDLK